MADFFDTPRTRRLRADLETLKMLKDNSSILDFQAFGDPPERYMITLKGKGLMRTSEGEAVQTADVHRVEIRLGLDYPRSRPDLQWLTSLYHPNISAVGAVCLGGYSTNWVPSLGLGELCEMLWDMVRYANYDPKSAYNYAAGRWSETQSEFDFPLDKRSIRDRLVKTVGDNVIQFRDSGKKKGKGPRPSSRPAPAITKPEDDGIFIIDDSTTPDSPSGGRPQPRPRPAPASDDDILIIE